MSDLILYTSEDGRSHVRLRAKGQTVWLTQREMAELFDASTDNIGLHLKNLYEDGELSREATTEESSVVQMEGTREVQRHVTLHNLDAMLAVGYQVSRDKDSGITNDPNDWCREHNQPRYIVDLIGRVVRVSMETMKIVKGLPGLNERQ